jgi:hypothetical protein
MEGGPFTKTYSTIPSPIDGVISFSKEEIFDFISKFNFGRVSVATTHLSNNNEQMVPFIEDFFSALTKTCIQHIPSGHSSPTKLLSSTPSIRRPEQEQDAPTKPRQTLASTTSSVMPLASVNLPVTSHDDTSWQQKRKSALEKMDLNSCIPPSFKSLRLTRTDAKKSTPAEHQRTIPFPPWDSPPLPYRPIDPVRDKKRIEALRNLKIDKDPYHIS